MSSGVGEQVRRRIENSTAFDEDLADDVLRANDDALFLLALARSDCPVGLLVDLSQAPSDAVRLAVARHSGTAPRTLERLARDEAVAVAAAALRGLE